MAVIRRRRRSAMPVPEEMNAEKMVKLIARLVRVEPNGRAQKTRGKRFDLPLPTNGDVRWSNGEVKWSDYHPYGDGGFRHSFSNLYGHGEGNDAEHYILVGTRRTPFDGPTPLDKAFFFLFFSRSQLLGICTRELDLPVNWEPGGVPPKDRSNTAQKHAAIWRAVVCAEDLEDVHVLVAANPNEPNAKVKPRTRSTMTRSERKEQALLAQIRDLKFQLDQYIPTNANASLST